jgi:hypothetical protein
VNSVASTDGFERPTGQGRRMVRADLMGAHSHATLSGIKVHVYRRDNRFIARGRYEGSSFGEVLGSDEEEAIARLRQLLAEIENAATFAHRKLASVQWPGGGP